MFSQLLEIYELKRKHNVTIRKWQGEKRRKRKVATKSDNDVFEDGFCCYVWKRSIHSHIVSLRHFTFFG